MYKNIKFETFYDDKRKHQVYGEKDINTIIDKYGNRDFDVIIMGATNNSVILVEKDIKSTDWFLEYSEYQIVYDEAIRNNKERIAKSSKKKMEELYEERINSVISWLSVIIDKYKNSSKYPIEPEVIIYKIMRKTVFQSPYAIQFSVVERSYSPIFYKREKGDLKQKIDWRSWELALTEIDRFINSNKAQLVTRINTNQITVERMGILLTGNKSNAYISNMYKDINKTIAYIKSMKYPLDLFTTKPYKEFETWVGLFNDLYNDVKRTYESGVDDIIYYVSAVDEFKRISVGVLECLETLMSEMENYWGNEKEYQGELVAKSANIIRSWLKKI